MRNSSIGIAAVLASLALSSCSTVIAPASTSESTSSAASSGASTTGGGGAATTSSSSSASGTGGAGGGPLIDTVMFAGKVVQSFGSKLPGVTVCVFDQPAIPCTTSDDQGDFFLPVPSFTETGITLAKQGVGGVLVAFETQGDDVNGWVIGLPSPTATRRTARPAWA
jgi:hypothetical protein